MLSKQYATDALLRAFIVFFVLKNVVGDSVSMW